MGLFGRRLRLRLFVMMVMVGGAARGFAAQAVLVADAHVNSALPGVNSGAISNLRVGGGYTALVQFDLSTLPAGITAAQVSRAVLRIYCNRVDTVGLVSLQSVGGAWGEYSVTYSSLPVLGSAAQVVEVSQAGAFVAVDVTALVQGWITAPATNNGLALTAGTAAVQFDSKENDLTGHAAELEISLVAQGPAGPAGPAGVQGAAGSPGVVGAVGPVGPIGLTGVAGPQGPQGAAGLQGPVGLQGLAGTAGTTGPPGAAGAAGSQGPPVSFLGGWLIGQSYAVGDAVSYGGASYIALTANAGREPDVSPVYWGVLAVAGSMGPAGAMGAMGLQGPTGFAGPQGVAGPVGATGPVGPAGTTGPAGPAGPAGAAGLAGLNYRGVYGSTTNYGLNDGVTYRGSSYISLAANNVGNSPDASPAFWALLAAQGAVGATGPAGAAGAAGPQGNAGAAGAAGSQGAAGVAGMSYKGAWSGVTSYAVNDAVLFGGTTYIATASAVGLEPDLYPAAWSVLAQEGSVGPSGPAGAAATVTVGTVTTGLAGSAAAVTNSGTASAAVLNFTIPQGAAGTNGSGGGSGGGLGSFASMYHAVSFNYKYYSVNTPNESLTEDPSVMAWVPQACTATTLTVSSQQGNAVTVTLRQGSSGSSGSMADTALACTVAAGGTCNVTGSVSVAAGSFVDLSVTGANATAAGVWTAVGCN